MPTRRNLTGGGFILKPFTKIAAVIFFFIAILHLLRLMSHWEISVQGVTIPQWVSIPVFLITGALSFMLWREANR